MRIEWHCNIIFLMKFTVEFDDIFREIEVHVKWNHGADSRYHDHLEQFLNIIRNGEREEADRAAVTHEARDAAKARAHEEVRIMVSKDGVTHILDAHEIFYTEIVDKRTFCYTVSGAYECAMKLYELEEKLTDLNFMKANKSCLFNFHFVRKIENDLNRTLLLTLENGFQVEVSRQYAGAVRKKLEEYHG